MKQIKDWFKTMFSSNASVSSKRFFGAIGFIWACIIITIWKRDLTETLLWVSAALLGLETIMNVFKKPGV